MSLIPNTLYFLPTEELILGESGPWLLIANDTNVLSV